MTCFARFGSTQVCAVVRDFNRRESALANKQRKLAWSKIAFATVAIIAFFSASPHAWAQCQGTFPSAYNPFDGGIAYVAGPNTSGDYVVVGYMSSAGVSSLGNIPLPNATNQQFCDTVPLSSSARYFAYVPTVAERAGNFSEFSGIIYDPTVGPSAKYSGGAISNLPGNCSSGCPLTPAGLPTGVFAWRIPAGETVFVSNGTGAQILAVDGNSGAPRLVVNGLCDCAFTPGGIVVGPDSKIYMTDSADSAIYRVNQDGSQAELVYRGVNCTASSPCNPEGPSFNGNDLYFNTLETGQGLFVITGAASTPFGGTFTAPANVEPGSCEGEQCGFPFGGTGTAFDSHGNLLAADEENSYILSLSPPYNTAQSAPSIIASHNTSPIGIGEPVGITLNPANGQVFVANSDGFNSQSESTANQIVQLVPPSAAGTPYTTAAYYTFTSTSNCGEGVLVPDFPEYLQSDPTGHLYATTSTDPIGIEGVSSVSGCGKVWRIDPTSQSPTATLVADLNAIYSNGFPGTCSAPCGLHSAQASGIALAQAASSNQTTQQGQTMQPGSPANLVQDFLFNGATGNYLDFHFDFMTAFNSGTLTVIANTTPFVTNRGITQSTYQAMVEGTSLATTSCLLAPGEGTDSNGNPLCAAMTLQCTNDGNSTPMGDSCPRSSARNLYWGQIMDIAGGNISVPAGTAPTLAMGSDTWTPPPSGSSGCTLVGPETGELCPHSILTQIGVIMDPPAKLGGTGDTSNSTFISGCCELLWNTLANIHLWNNTTSVPATFTTNPPSAPSPNLNNWVAAPNMSITYGWENLGQTPDTTYPVSGDVAVPNPTPCPSDGQWPAVGTVPPSFTTPTQTLSGVPGDGAYEVHYFSTDCTFFEELQFPSTINASSPENQNLATFKTMPFNVDTTAPRVTQLTLSPTGGYYAQNSTLTAAFMCSDPLSGGVASGIQYCGPQSEPGPTGPPSVTVTGARVNTNLSPGTYKFTATAQDYAGNSGSAQISYQIVGAAGVGIGMVSALTVQTGKNLTYLIGVANQGPNTAQNVAVTDTLPAGTSFVSAGYAVDSCSFGGGSPSCSIVPPNMPCSVSSGTVACSIGTLNAWTPRNPVGALIQITVKVTAAAKTVLTNAAKVSEANADNLPQTAIWPTLVTK
ncbi:MAG TPA: hypothetical protein VLW06_12090 [Terriglobales bacterium]|nr:hypothetical protein [Terriglobales bacterium]